MTSNSNTVPSKTKITALPSLSNNLCQLPYITSMTDIQANLHWNMDPERAAASEAMLRDAMAITRNAPSTPSPQPLYMPSQTYPQSQTSSQSPPDGLMMRSKSKFSI